MRDYDESKVLPRYVCEYFRHLLTDTERRVTRGWLVAKKAELAGKSVEEYFRDSEAEALAAALNGEPDGALALVAERIIRDHPDEVFINRCPSCTRVVATPKAQQCLWCGHDWH